MHTHSVIVACDVYCTWETTPPIYRVFVNDELFAERTWIWKDFYLEETLCIQAAPGTYDIKVELIDPTNTAHLKVKNPRVTQGRGSMHKLQLTILP